MSNSVKANKNSKTNDQKINYDADIFELIANSAPPADESNSNEAGGESSHEDSDPLELPGGLDQTLIQSDKTQIASSDATQIQPLDELVLDADAMDDATRVEQNTINEELEMLDIPEVPQLDLQQTHDLAERDTQNTIKANLKNSISPYDETLPSYQVSTDNDTASSEVNENSNFKSNDITAQIQKLNEQAGFANIGSLAGDLELEYKGANPNKKSTYEINQSIDDLNSILADVDSSIHVSDFDNKINQKIEIDDSGLPSFAPHLNKVEPAAPTYEEIRKSYEDSAIVSSTSISAKDETQAVAPQASNPTSVDLGEKTQAVSGYVNRADIKPAGDYNVKISVGAPKSTPAHFTNYSSGEVSDNLLTQSELLRIAQEKLIEIEKENEYLRLKNQELSSAVEVLKDRADLYNSQALEMQNDREQLKIQFQSEVQVVKNQLLKKDYENSQLQAKIDDYEARLKFDLKNIRVRERELENRLELVRAEKNTLLKAKDEQILDLKRKLDQSQLEVESFRQKCVELNKVIDENQESFKRTTRALRLAMSNLELHEDNKPSLKKVD